MGRQSLRLIWWLPCLFPALPTSCHALKLLPLLVTSREPRYGHLATLSVLGDCQLWCESVNKVMDHQCYPCQ